MRVFIRNTCGALACFIAFCGATENASADGIKVAGEVLRSGRALRARDVAADSRTFAREIAAEAGMRGWVGERFVTPHGCKMVSGSCSHRMM